MRWLSGWSATTPKIFEELTAEKAKLETLVSTIADGAILLDNDMQVVLVNPTARRFFGWEGKDLAGGTVLEHLPKTAMLQLTRPLYEVATRDSEGLELRITLNEPTHRTVRILLTTVLDQYREAVKGIAITAPRHYPRSRPE